MKKLLCRLTGALEWFNKMKPGKSSQSYRCTKCGEVRDA